MGDFSSPQYNNICGRYKYECIYDRRYRAVGQRSRQGSYGIAANFQHWNQALLAVFLSSIFRSLGMNLLC